MCPIDSCITASWMMMGVWMRKDNDQTRNRTSVTRTSCDQGQLDLCGWLSGIKENNSKYAGYAPSLGDPTLALKFWIYLEIQ